MTRSPPPLDPREIAGVRRALARAGAADCPRCGRPMERREVPPRPGVPYVRHRVWLLCAACGASAVLDRAEIRRERRGDGESPEPEGP